MPLERRPDPSLVLCHLDPLPARRRRRRLSTAESGAPQDFEHYALRDYARRRARGEAGWRDLRPAYAFALMTHAANWPRGGDDDTELQLAEQWERMRGQSRLAWARVRPVIEDAWQALDHLPASPSTAH